MEYKQYTDLEVWKESRKLANQVYDITKGFPKEELYGLTLQIRKCAISVPSNIAEGCGRNHAKDTQQFLYIARGSLYELETQSYLAFDQGYIKSSVLEGLLLDITTCKKLLNGFIRYFENLK